MKSQLLTAVFMTALLCACGGEEDSSSSGAGGSVGSTTASSTSAGGSSASGGGATSGGGMAADPCQGITPTRTVITPEQLLAMLDNKDFALINVHVPYAGEIPGTDTHISYMDVDAIEAYLGYDKGAKVVLYCRTGPMSEIAGNELVSRGYCNLSDMAAGSYTWEQLGYPYTP